MIRHTRHLLVTLFVGMVCPLALAELDPGGSTGSIGTQPSVALTFDEEMQYLQQEAFKAQVTQRQAAASLYQKAAYQTWRQDEQEMRQVKRDYRQFRMTQQQTARYITEEEEMRWIKSDYRQFRLVQQEATRIAHKEAEEMKRVKGDHHY